LVCTGANELFALDLATCQTTLIGISSTSFVDIAFTPNGRLWGCYGTVLYEIDPNNANDIVVGSMPGFGTVSLVAFNNDTLLGEYQAWLWGIRVSDGFAWRIDSIGYYATGDLTWYEGGLYMTAIGNPRKLIRMEVSDDLSSINNVEVVGPLIGGFGQWYGANTMMTDTCERSLIMLGFDVFDVYQISPSDASITMLCPSAFPTGTTGAASIGEMRVVQSAEKFVAPNVFSPNGDGLNDQLGPITNLGSVNWSLVVFNRWGQKVHDSNGLPIPWDGRTEAGESCPEGSYYYILTYTSNCDSGRSQGHVTLLRN
jgi:gliding motility-associated-like protein